MTDRSVVRLVVALLGAVALVLVSGIVGLALLEKPIPEGLLTLAGSALGALGAVLVSTRSGPSPDGPPVPVTVADAPLPVHETPSP